MAMCGDAWWFVVICGSAWRCVAVCGGVWQCLVVTVLGQCKARILPEVQIILRHPVLLTCRMNRSDPRFTIRA